LAVTKGLELIDREGLEALSLGALAKEMGVRAPSLYHHFSDKDELLSQVARRLLVEIDHEQERWSTDWETRTIELSLATRRVAMRHPNAVMLSLRFFPRQLMLPAYEHTLDSCPYPPAARAVLLEVIEKFTYGSSLFAAAAAAYHVQAMPEVEEARFPQLSAALAAAPATDEETYIEALHVIFAGLKARYGT
jgi:TetR/AcrR family transcriptional regulator, tetracycline repressor protein